MNIIKTLFISFIKEEIVSNSEEEVFRPTWSLFLAPGMTILTASCIRIHLSDNCDNVIPSGNIFFNSSTASNALLKFTPENVSPTIKGRDFVIATVAAPTIVKEPEKPAEETAEGAEGAEGGEAAGESTEGSKASSEDKPAEGEKAKEGEKKDEKKSPSEKK